MRLVHLRVRYERPARVDPTGALAAAWAALLAPAIGTPEWRPPCDVIEDARAWTLRAEIGGLAEDDLEIVLYEDSVVVQGVRRWPGAVPGVRVYLAEVRYGPFRLELDLPGGVDRAEVQARYEQGMLTLVLPKERPGGFAT